ncbi:MAG: response regulator [Cellvibrionaceae bacterium]
MGPSTQAQDVACTNHQTANGQRSRSANGAATRAIGDETKHPELNGIRTLIVEDNAVDRRVVMSTAANLGLLAEAVDSGEQAIERLKETDDGDFFDLLLIDFKMPDLDGLTASKYIKNDLALQHLPSIVLLSAYQKDEIFGPQGERSWVDGFLTKPIAGRSLAEMIADLQEAAKFKGETWPSRRQDGDAVLAKAHVLLAEDNVINQRVAAGILARKGIKVTIAQNGREAIDKVLGASPHTYHAILMDVDMPNVDGCQATRQIKDSNDYSQIPIIALTAHNSPADRTRCLNAGMSAYLTKPIKPDLLFFETLLSFLK